MIAALLFFIGLMLISGCVEDIPAPLAEEDLLAMLPVDTKVADVSEREKARVERYTFLTEVERSTGHGRAIAIII